jgi:transcriptional regulator with XRE-family HTH domain
MVDYTDKLSDSEKFVIILQKYCNEYNTQKDLAQEMGIPKQSISDWKNHSRTIRIKNRNSISKKFRLRDMVWIDTFENAANFEEKLDCYKIIEKVLKEEESLVKLATISQNIISPITNITLKEKELLTALNRTKEITLDDYNLEPMSSIFLFKLSKLLKNRNQIKEALTILNMIETNQGSFKYSHHNEIEHFKAILLSHDKIQKWETSIDILRLLYVGHYHIEEPEIITLLASNYKRQALYSANSNQKWRDKDEIDIDLLSSAIILYREAYEAKKGETRYYDAINFAYLYSLASRLEMEKPNSVELKEMYNELMSEWTINKSDWWEVSSHAEFLMLIGQSDLAILNITVFLEEHNIEKFNIESTLRQLEMYLHFTKNTHAERFYTYLHESWGYIEKSFL